MSLSTRNRPQLLLLPSGYYHRWWFDSRFLRQIALCGCVAVCCAGRSTDVASGGRQRPWRPIFPFSRLNARSIPVFLDFFYKSFIGWSMAHNKLSEYWRYLCNCAVNDLWKILRLIARYLIRPVIYSGGWNPNSVCKWGDWIHLAGDRWFTLIHIHCIVIFLEGGGGSWLNLIRDGDTRRAGQWRMNQIAWLSFFLSFSLSLFLFLFLFLSVCLSVCLSFILAWG